MKVCHHCKQSLPLSMYNRRSASKDGLQGTCKDCNKERSRIQYLNDSTRIKAANKDRSRRYRAACHKALAEYVISHGGCEDCGYNDHPAAMDFDHKDPSTKTASISIMVTKQMAWHKILSELEKCRILCSNCHRIRTSEQLGWYLQDPGSQTVDQFTSRSR